MKYAGYMPNDFINGENVSVSFWVSGCPHHCPGCHNEKMWDYDFGTEVPEDIKGQLIKAISANGITRNFSVLGGEPLCLNNLKLVHDIVSAIRVAYPHIKIYLWTGYTISEIKILENNYPILKEILNNIDVLIEGRYEQEKRDISLKLKGSSNQHVLVRGIDF